MSAPRCRRCRSRLIPVYPGQSEHPSCSTTPTGWIPKPPGHQTGLDLNNDAPVRLALDLAGLGWHVFPLSPTSRRPFGNCPACRTARTSHPIEQCPCLPAGRWCHGVRAATTDPATITRWWQTKPDAIPGVAAGPSDLVLVDIDNHDTPLPDDLATGLLPGINLANEPIPDHKWDDPRRYHDGRDTLRLLAQLRGGTNPWPVGPRHRPVTVTTPSGAGRHLWYRAPAPNLHQALSDHGLGWQIDIKAGWSYGIAPGATTAAGKYQLVAGDLANPGNLPDWLAHEVIRVTTPRPSRPAPSLPQPRPAAAGRGPAGYLTTVINRGANRLTTMRDGRKRALAALAYHAGGLLDWSGLDQTDVTNRLIAAGTNSELAHNQAQRITHRALARGIAEPLPAPGTRPGARNP